jgi:fatty-acyl-CoA synthase
VLGERIAVLFKPAAGVRVTPDEIRAWAKTRLQPYEVPDEINLVDELPLGGTGKMDRLSAREFHKVVTSELGTQ